MTVGVSVKGGDCVFGGWEGEGSKEGSWVMMQNVDFILKIQCVTR